MDTRLQRANATAEVVEEKAAEKEGALTMILQGPLKCPTCKQPTAVKLERGEARYVAHTIHWSAVFKTEPRPSDNWKPPYCTASGDILNVKAQRRLYRQQLFTVWKQTAELADASEEVSRAARNAAAAQVALLTLLGMAWNDNLQDYAFKDDPQTPLSEGVL